MADRVFSGYEKREQPGVAPLSAFFNNLVKIAEMDYKQKEDMNKLSAQAAAQEKLQMMSDQAANRRTQMQIDNMWKISQAETAQKEMADKRARIADMMITNPAGALQAMAGMSPEEVKAIGLYDPATIKDLQEKAALVQAAAQGDESAYQKLMKKLGDNPDTIRTMIDSVDKIAGTRWDVWYKTVGKDWWKEQVNTASGKSVKKDNEPKVKVTATGTGQAIGQFTRNIPSNVASVGTAAEGAVGSMGQGILNFLGGLKSGVTNQPYTPITSPLPIAALNAAKFQTPAQQWNQLPSLTTTADPRILQYVADMLTKGRTQAIQNIPNKGQ